MIQRPQLDEHSNVPIYRQLYLQIRHQIENKELGEGDRLPATRELAGLLGLNRTTVSAAYELLETEGLIHGHVGRGSFVSAHAVGAPPLRWEDLLVPAPPSAAALPVGPGGISFANSRPPEDLFPLAEFRATCAEVAADASISALLQLGSPAGYLPLRRRLLETARQEGIARDGDDILITSGCQQAIDLVERVLIRAGDTVAMEDPVYPGLKNVFLAAGTSPLGIEVGADGLQPGSLASAIRSARPKLLVLTPNFQNPTGTTLPLGAREEVVRISRGAGIPVVEIDIYGGLRYDGKDLPALKRLDDSGDTILLGSFSKIAFPGLRVGWIVAPKPVVQRLIEAKQRADLHTDQLSQAVLLRFLETGRLEAHRGRMVTAGAERLRATLEACERFLPASARFTRPQGGMNLWVRLREPLDAAELLPRAIREGVNYLPGKYFAVGREEAGSLRLSFAGLRPEAIREGIRKLGKVFGEEAERVRQTHELETAPAMV